MAQPKIFTLHFSDVTNPFGPALLTVSDDGSLGPYLMYMKNGIDHNGKIAVDVWGVGSSDEYQRDVLRLREAHGFDRVYQHISGAKLDDEKKEHALEIECMSEIVDHINSTPVYSMHRRVTNSLLLVDFWKSHMKGETRPYKHAKMGVDAFTFGALKLMWKTLGKSGHSSKSKTDLFEGFAETSVENVSSEKAEAFLATLPKKMVTVSIPRPSSYDKPDVEDAIKGLAMVSRISAGSLFAADQSPDIDEKNVIEAYRFIDFKDPYAESIETPFGSEAAALEDLKHLYAPLKD